MGSPSSDSYMSEGEEEEEEERWKKRRRKREADWEER